MKKKYYFLTAAVGIIFVTMILGGCVVLAPSHDNGNRIQLNTSNHWEFLNITIVRVNAEMGTRLQFFPEIENGTFENVTVRYSAYVDNLPFSQVRIIRLSSNGVGQTMTCTRFFPIILEVSGSVIVS